MNFLEHTSSIITSPLLCGYILFLLPIPLPLPSKTLTPKPNFRVRTGTLFSAEPNSLSNVSPPSIHFIIPPPRMLYTTLGLPPSPPLTCNPTSISPPHSDKPGVPQHSTLAGVRATNMFSYFIAAARSRSSRQSRVLSDQYLNPRVVTQAPSKEKGDLGQGDVFPGSRTIASLDKGGWRQSRQFFGASSCKVEKMQFSSHTCTFEKINYKKIKENSYWRVSGI